jgi:cardiolipin synthase A/B
MNGREIQRRNGIPPESKNKKTAVKILPAKGFMRYCHTLFFFIVCMSVITVCGCAGFPEKTKITTVAPTEKPPFIMGAQEPFSKEKSRTVIDRLQRQVGPTAILSHHIRAMEKISKTPIISGNKVTLLRDGPETLAAMKEAIRNARDHIHMEIFIFRDDEVGRPLADLLIEKQAQGVQVRLIYDGFGSRKTPKQFFDRMQAAGIALYEFNPFCLLDLTGQWKPHNRDHRKIIVVDGKIAFTGGINFYHVYAKSPDAPSSGNNKEKLFWRDTQIKIQGPAVAEFQKLFLETWFREKENIMLQSNLFPRLDEKGNTLVRVISSSPEQHIPHIYAAYISAIMHAKKSIYISQAYFIPNTDLLDALSHAVQKDVDVQIIVPGESDFWLPVYAGQTRYRRLLESGVRLHKMKDTVLHAKTIVIDGVWSMVGSSNMDPLSFLHLTEVNAVILSTDFAKKMEDMFKEDLSKSEEIFLKKWKQRPYYIRFMEKIARIFDYWL